MPSSVSLITYLKNSSFNIRSSEVFKLTVETSNLINLNIRLDNCYCLYLFILADKCPPTRMPSSTFFCPQSLHWMAYSSLYVIMCLGLFFFMIDIPCSLPLLWRVGSPKLHFSYLPFRGIYPSRFCFIWFRDTQLWDFCPQPDTLDSFDESSENEPKQ